MGQAAVMLSSVGSVVKFISTMLLFEMCSLLYVFPVNYWL